MFEGMVVGDMGPRGFSLEARCNFILIPSRPGSYYFSLTGMLLQRL